MRLSLARLGADLECTVCVACSSNCVGMKVTHGLFALALAGMAATDRVVQRTKRTGLGLLDPASGLSALYSVFAAKADARRTIGLLAVAPVEWQVLLRPSQGSNMPLFFSDVATDARPATTLSAVQRPSLMGALLDAADPASASVGSSTVHPPSSHHTGMRMLAQFEALATVQGVILKVVHDILGSAIDPFQPFMEAGLDSLGAQLFYQHPVCMLRTKCCALRRCTASRASCCRASARLSRPSSCAGTIELRNALGAVFGVELAPTAVLDYPNVAALAGHLAGIVLPSPSGDTYSQQSGPWEYQHTVPTVAGVPTAVEQAPPLAALRAVSYHVPQGRTDASFSADAPCGKEHTHAWSSSISPIAEPECATLESCTSCLQWCLWSGGTWMHLWPARPMRLRHALVHLCLVPSCSTLQHWASPLLRPRSWTRSSACSCSKLHRLCTSSVLLRAMSLCARTAVPLQLQSAQA